MKDSVIYYESLIFLLCHEMSRCLGPYSSVTSRTQHWSYFLLLECNSNVSLHVILFFIFPSTSTLNEIRRTNAMLFKAFSKSSVCFHLVPEGNRLWRTVQGIARVVRPWWCTWNCSAVSEYFRFGFPLNFRMGQGQKIRDLSSLRSCLLTIRGFLRCKGKWTLDTLQMYLYS